MATRSPTRTACFRPDEYRALDLFANRQKQLGSLTDDLASFIEPGAPGQGRVLVRGQRGVGKSMLTRKAIDALRYKYGPLIVTADGTQSGGSDKFMRQLARDLAKEILENVSDDDLRKSADFLHRLSATTELTVKQAREWASNLKMSINVKHRFYDSLGLEFGWQRTRGAKRVLEETHKRSIDADFLRERIQDLVSDCHREGQRVVLFLDNLDQVGYAEIEEDVRRVTDLARYLLGLERCVVVANLRSEFVSADLRKLNSLPIEVEGLRAEELMEIFDQRVLARGEGTRERLAETGLLAIAQTLSRRTDNAWAFLSWLAFLDYQTIDFEAGDTARLDKLLERFALQNYTGIRLDEMIGLAAPYSATPSGYLTCDELVDIPADLIERATRYGVLVPDWLLSPDRYLFSPTLSFLIGRE